LGEQDGGEALTRGIVFGRRVVEEASRRCDLVLKIGKLALQLLEILMGLQVQIGFGEREDLARCALQLRRRPAPWDLERRRRHCGL